MVEKKRGFEVVSKYQDQKINLPTRATKFSAGYDFEAAINVEIPSIWQAGIQSGWSAIKSLASSDKNDHFLKPTLVATGVKAYMARSEFLELANRSSNPLKRFLVLANGVGIIDSDYYNNADNEGHIMFQFINFGFSAVIIRKGERIGQGIFHTFLKADQDRTTSERTSGFGSTGRA